jgi:hypothetical protein
LTTDAAFKVAFTQLVNSGEISDPDNVSGEQLYQLIQQGKLPKPTWPTTTYLDSQVGQQCFPGDTSTNPGLVCQPATETVTINGVTTTTFKPWFMGPYLANASKGDVLLSSASSDVGAMLHSMSNPQGYSHSGIMLDNGFHVRHDTAAADRYSAYHGSTGSIDENVLKYGFPGTVSESIQDAYLGAAFVDGNSKSFTTSSFELYDNKDDRGPIPQGVLRPPLGATNENDIRQILESTAKIAATISAHYRFYSYSDATIANDATNNAPAGVGSGLDGSVAAVCSTFIWKSLQQVPVSTWMVPACSGKSSGRGLETHPTTRA